jgi:hypothetical protein
MQPEVPEGYQEGTVSSWDSGGTQFVGVVS